MIHAALAHGAIGTGLSFWRGRQRRQRIHVPATDPAAGSAYESQNASGGVSSRLLRRPSRARIGPDIRTQEGVARSIQLRGTSTGFFRPRRWDEVMADTMKTHQTCQVRDSFLASPDQTRE